MPKRKTTSEYADEEAYHIDDEDGDTGGELDPCDNCDCARADHEDGVGECACGYCRKFKEPK